MARRLKVFQTRLGFYDTVVAAPSQPAALKAWGVKQNLFASGEARQVEDAETVALAEAHPETPLRRVAGSNDPFALEAVRLPSVPPGPKGGRAAKPSGGKPARGKSPKSSPKPVADRSSLEAAEAALVRLNDARKREEAAFRQEANELEARQTAAQKAYVKAHKAAAAKIARARAAYRKAGGAD